MFRFANPEYLYILLLLPVLISIYIYSNVRRNHRLNTYGERELVRQLMPQHSEVKSKTKFWLLFAAFSLSCFLLARPQFGTKQETVVRSGIETMICLDISNSMLADDVAPTRLGKSKRIVSNLVDQFKDDKVGLIVFAGDAFVQLPITNDFVSAKLFLESITPSLINRQGTNIKDAIDLASKSFSPNDKIGKAIIVITDGENHEEGAIEAAEAAGKKNIVVHVMGIGSVSGSPIPGEHSGEFRKDMDGNVIVTRLNEQMCRDIAIAGNGSYFFVDNTNASEKALQKELDHLAKDDIKTNVYTEYDEQFHVIAWIIMLLLLVELLLSERRYSMFDKLKLYSKHNELNK